jgi:hypothetical protein
MDMAGAFRAAHWSVGEGAGISNMPNPPECGFRLYTSNTKAPHSERIIAAFKAAGLDLEIAEPAMPFHEDTLLISHHHEPGSLRRG